MRFFTYGNDNVVTECFDSVEFAEWFIATDTLVADDTLTKLTTTGETQTVRLITRFVGFDPMQRTPPLIFTTTGHGDDHFSETKAEALACHQQAMDEFTAPSAPTAGPTECGCGIGETHSHALNKS